jgi:hypothetical protein
MTIDLPWIPLPDTEERILRHYRTGQIIEFTDDIVAPEQEYPIIGLADMFSQEDMNRLMRRYTPYELASGGA